MSVDEIIREVRWCIDEESNNTSEIVDEKDDMYMDNIIKSMIPQALHWIAITATGSSVLSQSANASKSSSSDTVSLKIEKFEEYDDVGVITMPSNIFVFNINRVRAKGWHKGVVPAEDTEDEGLMMFDDTAKGTSDRPCAAIMRVTPMQILIQPIPEDGTVTISYVGVPTGITAKDGEETVEISDTFKSAFIHYLAFLLLSSCDDTKANQMYTIALQQLGMNQTSK